MGSLTGISEVVLRVDDLAGMEEFYGDVLGLEPWRTLPGLSFLRVADVDSPLGRSGHPETLALVDRSRRPWHWAERQARKRGPRRSALDHLAFEIQPAAFEGERARLEALGLETQVTAFPDLEARALFFSDPDGNVLEFLAHEPGPAGSGGESSTRAPGRSSPPTSDRGIRGRRGEEAPGIARLLEIFLIVADVERARAFYEDSVGLELLGDPRPDRCAFRVLRGQLLGLVDRTAAAEANEVPGGVIPPCLPGGSDPPATGSHLAFAIPREDLEPWRQRLIGRGVDVLAEVRWERGGRSLYFRGPEEALLELATPGVWEFY